MVWSNMDYELVNEITKTLQKPSYGLGLSHYLKIGNCVAYLKLVENKADADILTILTNEFGGCLIGSEKFNTVCDYYNKLCEEFKSLHEIKDDFN